MRRKCGRGRGKSGEGGRGKMRVREEAGGAGTDGGVEGLGSGQSEVWKDHGDRRD